MPELKELSLGEDLIKDSVLDLLKRVVMKGLDVDQISTA